MANETDTNTTQTDTTTGTGSGDTSDAGDTDKGGSVPVTPG